MSILPDLSHKSRDELQAMVQAMQAKLEAAKASRKITMKVSDKGALSVYGLGRFPVTLYQSQWERLLGEKEAIQGFIRANQDTLSQKD
jgi:hypothetical protein